ncbi:uncharacterized protein MYCFIDRAFT_205210 [Pseudocercospora fijiensis CIRAD86]|uniref:Uncharacterized protein n=1 Tax=Pseudocercospora fijiensis (strain CIRAD86) TaxID=383855 RepID=M3A2Z1_PSEFD|nr:uncharacterized protein MYCFIDRAFT_205210 [Pseudocercospora fijiensis CIRAD86]EME78931.1 hypothetical protein MYCFIDRAFT_205210 [Pseudocercospora fijiensis CIRAD86]
MSGSGPSQWQWHQQFGQWCYFDRATQQYLLQDGRRFAIRNQQPSRPWVQEAVAAYRLRQSVLEQYLRRKFPEREYGRRGFAIELWRTLLLLPSSR